MIQDHVPRRKEDFSLTEQYMKVATKAIIAKAEYEIEIEKRNPDFVMVATHWAEYESGLRELEKLTL